MRGNTERQAARPWHAKAGDGTHSSRGGLADEDAGESDLRAYRDKDAPSVLNPENAVGTDRQWAWGVTPLEGFVAAQEQQGWLAFHCTQ